MLRICDFHENPHWENLYFSYRRKLNYVRTCTLKRHDIWKVKNALLISVYYVTEDRIFDPFLSFSQTKKKVRGAIFQLLCQICIRSWTCSGVAGHREMWSSVNSGYVEDISIIEIPLWHPHLISKVGKRRNGVVMGRGSGDVCTRN